MGFRFRKSFKIAPGIKLNVGKKGIGISAGTKGARVSVNSSGRVTKSLSIPGTGVSYVKSSKIGGKKSASKASKPSLPKAENTPPKPQNPSNGPQPPKTYRGLRILGIILVVCGLILTCTSIVQGLVSTAIGCAILHYRASKLNTDTRPFYRKRWQIVVAVMYVLLAVVGLTTPDSTTPVAITQIKLSSPDAIDLAVPDPMQIEYTYSPKDASAGEIEFNSSDLSVLTVEAMRVEDGKIVCQVTPLAAGQATLTCKSGDVSAPDVKLTITDPVAEQEAEAARQAAEQAEQERIAAEKAEQERIAAEQAEQERLAAEKAEQERIAAEQAAQAEQQSGGQTVYITPSGERYHLDPNCGGKNSYPVDISEVGGRTPCKKCAGG